MPRVTKAMLLEDSKRINRLNGHLMREVEHFKEMNKLLATRQFDVDAFCSMHANAMEAVAHVVSDLRIFRK